MLEKKYRFHGHGSLRRLHRQSNIVRHRSMTLKYSSNPHRVHGRCAVIVAKKVSKRATVRNRIRRRIYETFRQQINVSRVPYDVAFSVYDIGLAVSEQSELDSLVASLLADAGITSVPPLSDS